MKQPIYIEYLLNNTSSALLWSYIADAQGLSEWFADDVRIENKQVTFIWNKSEQKAHIIGIRQEIYIRLRWDDEIADKTYFEMRINKDELTGTTSLYVVDHADLEEMDDLKELWDKQIDGLKRLLGVS